MTTNHSNVMTNVGWALVGLLLVPLLFAGVFGGMFLLLAAVAFIVLVAKAATVLKRKPRYAVSQEAVAETPALGAVEAVAVSAPMEVIATVVDAGGVCPMGRAFRVGETWTLNGEWSGGGPCPRAGKLLTQAAEWLRGGQAAEGNLWQCLGKGHRVVFQLRKSDRGGTATPVSAMQSS